MMFTSLFSFSLLSAEAAARSGIPWWVWVILILILLVILWYWFGREEEPTKAEPQEEPVASKASTVEVEPAVEAPSQPVKPDDLKKIEGIGPKVSGLLNQAGIMTFQQMVDAGAEKLESILDQAGLQMLNADTWPEQAKLAADGDFEGLKKLQDELKGGKRV
jgi:predicted flap endonuclease-1-like 5' DNA nuclease